MKIQSICNRCQAPIFFDRIIDSFGNIVLTLHCWNGHYEWIEFENIEEETAKDPKNDLILYLGFFD